MRCIRDVYGSEVQGEVHTRAGSILRIGSGSGLGVHNIPIRDQKRGLGAGLGLGSNLVHWKKGMRTHGGHLEGVGEGLCCETDSLLGGPASHLMVDLLKCIQRHT